MTSYLTNGRFGPVFSGTMDGLPVAMKKLAQPHSEEKELAFFREAFLISQFNHPNVVKGLAVVIRGEKVRLKVLRSGEKRLG